MIEKNQLRSFIKNVLKDLEPHIPYSESAVELLMLTAAVESNMGSYIEQVGGPAKGVFQMEPATEKDIWLNFLAYKPELASKIKGYMSQGKLKDELKWNLAYSVAMARVLYFRCKTNIPDNNPIELASYWKQHYNTPLGKGTIQKAKDKYELMAI